MKIHFPGSILQPLVGLLLLLSFYKSHADEGPVAHQGLLDARHWQLKNNRLPLNGFWNYYEGQLLTPVEIKNSQATLVLFPQLWNATAHSGQGFCTYSLLVVGPAGQHAYSIDLPQIYSAYHLWINGTLVASNGKPGKTKEETIPQWMPQTIPFETKNDSIEVVLQIANFNHHKGGIKEPIYLGSSDLLYNFRRTASISNLAEAVTLWLIGIVFLLTYLRQERKKIILYFALLCLTWGLRSVFSNQYLFISYFPHLNWELMVKVEYITLYLTMIWAILFLGRLFSKESNLIIKYLLVIGNSLFTAYTVLTPALYFTRWLNVYLIFSALLLAYGAFLVLRALANERAGAIFLTISITLGLGIFAYDFFAFEGLFSYSPIVFSTGYILIFLSMGLALLMHLNIIKSNTETITVLRYDDLFEKK